ncbi:MAG: hypothetical protein RIS64_3967 [Bacteroidota bacterium]|jgi:hypothetical protein
MELAFRQGVVVRLWILAVERLDWYEWFFEQEFYKIQSLRTEWKVICPTRVSQTKGFSGEPISKEGLFGIRNPSIPLPEV